MFALYSQKRNEIKTGDLLAWKTTKINSFFDFVLFLYQKILKAEYTHVGIAVKEGDRLFIVEATPPVVRLFPISLCDDFYLIQTDIENKTSHVDVLLRHLGKKYSLFDLIRSSFKLGNSNSDFYCSELAGSFYNDIGFINDENAGFTPDSIVYKTIETSRSVPIFVKVDRGNLDVV